MSEQEGAAVLAGLGLLIAVGAVVSLALYIFFCFCAKRICQKCGKDPGVLIWIPILNLIPLLEVAGLPVWTIILFFVPLANFVMPIVMWAKLCTARGKSGWLVLGIIFLPIVFIPYLAFSE